MLIYFFDLCNHFLGDISWADAFLDDRLEAPTNYKIMKGWLTGNLKEKRC